MRKFKWTELLAYKVELAHLFAAQALHQMKLCDLTPQQKAVMHLLETGVQSLEITRSASHKGAR